MRKNKSKKSEDRAERRKIEHEIMLNKQMDKTDPYPERINIKKDSLRSDLFCMRNYGSAYMTVVSTADDSTISYMREDSMPSQKDNQELSEIIEKQKESLLIWKDRVLSMQAANLAVKTTGLIWLKRLVLRFFICYFLMFMTTAVFYGYYTYIKENNILIYAGIILLLLFTIYITWYATKLIHNLQIMVDDYQFQKLEDESVSL